MAEYIERERLLEIIKSLIIPYAGLRSGKKVLNELLMSYREAVLEKIQEAPVADVAPVVHARWKFDFSDPADPQYVCSKCLGSKHRYRRSHQKMKFCPACGAKMDLEDENDG